MTNVHLYPTRVVLLPLQTVSSSTRTVDLTVGGGGGKVDTTGVTGVTPTPLLHHTQLGLEIVDPPE